MREKDRKIACSAVLVMRQSFMLVKHVVLLQIVKKRVENVENISLYTAVFNIL